MVNDEVAATVDCDNNAWCQEHTEVLLVDSRTVLYTIL
jgi:hypothetical protein